MHVGMSTFFQNLNGLTDREVYRNELALADQAEPLSFDSIWSAEHHFDNYTMCPNVSQFLTYMAGRTRRVQLGSMVMVVPWHDPVRLAEEISVLDHVSDGRAILGFGRGLGRVEFDGFRLDMGQSRQRFVEHTEAILGALETGVIQSDGKLYQQKPIQIRPTPFRSFKGRVYASAVSPESARIMARLGIGVMIIAQKPWDKTVAELNEYRAIYREMHPGSEPPKPLMVCFVACHEDAAMAQEMHERYTRGYSRSALEHYEFHNEGLADINGYEYYGALARNISKHGIDAFVNFLADLQVRGTPEQVLEQMLHFQRLTDCSGFVTIFSYGGMPYPMAQASMRLFASHVLPKLKALNVEAEVGGMASAA